MTDIQKPDAPDEDIDARIACVLAEYEAHDPLKILAPSLLPQKGKRWTTFTPPAAAPCRRFRGLVSHRRSQVACPVSRGGCGQSRRLHVRPLRLL
ncbi:hypothetical protein [Paracoccus actinidiae]|uniref:hypothetical protein n=1 Tax=Paracoccus actinidiae TaxID=3064531 RepID=UPI0027D34399|nr:hypothetical protein [Paracoccus sp. M09]